VKNPGSFSATDIKTIYDAIGKAGGFTLDADKRHVKLIRQHTDGSRDEKLINFPKQVYKAYDADSGIGQETYLLKEGDLICVPASRLKQIGLFTLRLSQIATIGIISGVVSVIIN
jgi:protein involved in polysaccharide export with SLBB domain